MICESCFETTDIDELEQNSGTCNNCYNEEHNISIETDQQCRDRIKYERELSDSDISLYLTDPEGEA